MLNALQIMLVVLAVTVVTGFLIALLIQLLCRMVQWHAPKNTDEAEMAALAVALAIRRRRKQ